MYLELSGLEVQGLGILDRGWSEFTFRVQPRVVQQKAFAFRFQVSEAAV